MEEKTEIKSIEFRKKIKAQFQIRAICKIAKKWGMSNNETLWCLLAQAIAIESDKINCEFEDGKLNSK